MLDTLKRQLKQFRTLAIDVYDRLEADPNQLRNQLAIVIDNRQARENPVRLDEDFAFPEVYSWEDERIEAPDLDRVEWVVPIKGYNSALPFNKVNIERPDVVARLERIVPKLPPAYFRKQIKHIMEVFRLNPLAYDGQNFFDTDHTHPAGKGTYDNTIDTGFTTEATPTFDEAKALIHAVRARFSTNLTIQAEVLSAGEVSQGLIVIVHNAAHWSMFERVRSVAAISNVPNELAGTFTLLQDAKPASGAENYIEFVLSMPGGMRPAFLVIDKDPVLDAWEDNKTRNGYVDVGIQAMHGVKPGFPQCAIRASAL